ncbi:MAG TPA: circadian clock protein KaiC [Cytophagaceae bacterium]
MGTKRSTAFLQNFKFPKVPTGIEGLDELTEGGLPKGRPTLICGSAGCGKTLLAMEFLVRGATQFDEPGVFIAFEETAEDLAMNVGSLGFDLKDLSEQKKIKIDYVHVDRSEIEETGEYDLQGLFVRLGYAIASIGAKRIVLDTLESLFSGLTNQSILRAEIRRLFHYLKEKGITAVITGERGEATLTKQGLEEYVSDCVILLDHRIIDQISTRRLRIVKYRGTTHGTNEYPFLIDENGISVLPITSLGLQHHMSDEIISTGVDGMDEMLGLGGFYKGSSVLITGTAGTAKTTFASSFANRVCESKQKCLFFAFEESTEQLLRNMKQVGIDLQPHIDNGYLMINASRPSIHGLEMHLVTIHKLIKEFKPDAVVIDPISNLISVGGFNEVRGMLTRLIDYLKVNQITAFFNALTTPTGKSLELTEEGISSLVDTWILVRDVEGIGERNRGIFIIKSRGMNHSNQVREFIITANGIKLLDINIGPTGILTGSARLAYQLEERNKALAKQMVLERKDRELARKKKILEATIDNMRTEFESIEEELRRIDAEERELEKIQKGDAADSDSSNKNKE